MEDQYNWDSKAIADTILIPLAAMLEKFSQLPTLKNMIALGWVLSQKDFKQAYNYIFWEKPLQAQAIAEKVNAAINQLLNLPEPQFDAHGQIGKLFEQDYKRAVKRLPEGSFLERAQVLMRQPQPSLTEIQERKLRQIEERRLEEIERMMQTAKYQNAINTAREAAEDLRQFASMMIADEEKHASKAEEEIEPDKKLASKSYPTALGHNLDEYRNRLGFSMKRLAEEIGISERSIKSYISGGVIPSAKYQKKLYDYFTKTHKLKVKSLDLSEILPNIDS